MGHPFTGGEFIEGSNPIFVANVPGPDGVALVQADITSITLVVYDLSSDTPATAVKTLTLTIASVVFDTGQSDGFWDGMPGTYNFRYELQDSNFTPDGTRRYRFEFKFVVSKASVYAGVIPVAFEATCLPMFS